MSAVKDLNELHIGIKSSFLTITLQIPFFFISIFLFRHNLIDKIDHNIFYDFDFYFLICLCFCFSITWFMLNIVCTWLTLSFADKLLNTQYEPHELYIATMVYSIVYLSIAIVLTHTFSWTFNTFLIGAYCFIAIRIIWVLAWEFITTKFFK